MILWGSHVYYAICHFGDFERIYHRKGPKRRQKNKFRRRRLPYHYVMRCYSHIGNHPHLIGNLRFESCQARRLKIRSRKVIYRRRLKRLRRRVKLSEDRALYEAWTTGSPPVFQLECPDIDLLKPILNKLGPGGIIGGDFDTFDLEIPNPGSVA